MTKVSFWILCVGLLPIQLWAISTDADQPISVEADRLEVREADNISIYEGNVLLVQGSLQINSDRLVIHFNDGRQLRLLEMTGAPARFRQLNDEQQEMLGQAMQIDYNKSESSLELRNEARFTQAGDTIESNLIRIDTNTNHIEAGSGGAEQRVKVFIQPVAE